MHTSLPPPAASLEVATGNLSPPFVKVYLEENIVADLLFAPRHVRTRLAKRVKFC